jgi:D-3-phosphoglycerate dehydrogenase
MNGRILVTARSFRKTEGPHKQILRDAGYELVESTNEQPLSAADLIPWITDVDGAILGLDAVTEEVLAAAGRLRVISRYGVGTDAVDLAGATRHGVVVTITPGANSVAVAELALALLLALARSIPYHDRVAKGGKWSRVQGMELAGATIGLVGLGRIGREVALRAAALGMHVLVCDPLLPPEGFAGLPVARCGLEDLLAASDAVSLHLPLTDGTRNLIDARALARMKPPAYLINTARGGLVDEQALHEALAARRLAGAACDVFAQEPPDAHGLVSLDNFIAAPHIGSASAQTTLKMGLMAAENALAVLRGEKPQGVVNPEVYDLAPARFSAFHLSP